MADAGGYGGSGGGGFEGFGAATGAGPTAEDRKAAIVRLRRHVVSGGSLSAEELADRVRRIESAQTRAGIDQVLADLPALPDDTRWVAPGAPSAPTPDDTATAPLPGGPPLAPAASPPLAPMTGPPLASPSTPPTPPTPAPQPPPRWSPTAAPSPAGSTRTGILHLLLALLLAAGLFGGLAVFVVSSEGDGDADSAGRPGGATAPAPAPTAPRRTTEVPTRRTTTSTRPTTSAPAPTSAPEAPFPDDESFPTDPGELGDLAEDVLRVGEDIQPGRYLATPGGLCYWERVSGFDGGFDDVIVNGAPGGRHVIVDVQPGDAGLRSSGCGEWRPYAPPPAAATTFGDGDWLVGSDVAPGTYRSSTASGCYWERGTDFTHDVLAIIDNAFVENGPATVTVHDGETFTSDFCGTWTPT